jgi:hypothetical protein
MEIYSNAGCIPLLGEAQTESLRSSPRPSSSSILYLARVSRIHCQIALPLRKHAGLIPNLSEPAPLPDVVLPLARRDSRDQIPIVVRVVSLFELFELPVQLLWLVGPF